MKNKFKLHFSKLKIVFTTSAIVLLLVLFFSPNKTIKAEEKDYDISFYIDELNSYSLTYSEGETISEIPTLNSDYFFVGWYDNESFDGANYFGMVVSELTPNNLYALVYYKDPVLDDLEVVPYLEGYEITLYKGTATGNYLNIPSHYINETETEGLYEVKDILSIAESTFVSNNDVFYITIPETITNIDNGAFSYLNNLTGVYVNPENEYYSSDSYGVLLNKQQTEIIHFPANLYYDAYKAPESLQIIKTNTFSNNLNLKKVIIGSNVLTIQTKAFNNNLNLESVLINDGLLETIQTEAFFNNDKLTKVMIPSTVTYVGSDAFKGSSLSLDIYYQDKISNIPTSWEDDWNVTNFNVIEEYDLITYTVTYLNDDDSIIDTEVVSFNSDAVKEVTATKENNAQYFYIFSHFAGEELTNIVNDITVKAIYYEELRSYNVTFYDALGEVYGVKSFPYGENPNNNYWFTDVKKDADLEYRYYFERWDQDLTFIESDLFVYPVFRSELIYYSVIFYSADLENQFEYYSLPYNASLEAPDVNPTKESTEVHDYVFTGWYLDLEKTILFEDGNIEGDLHVYPKFAEVLRTYLVEFYNNNVLYDSQNVAYGSSANTPADPTRAQTDKYYYEFIGWSVEFSNIISYLRVDALYNETIRSYTVKFYNGEELISEQTVLYEQSAIAPCEPTKESDAKYSYTFNGWDKSFNEVRSNLNVYATYTQTPNVYSVSYNTNGGSLIETHNQTYNTYITRPANPTKVGYSFVGWYKDSSLLTEWSFNTLMPASNLTLYAKWNLNSYTVTFNSLGGSSVLPLDVFYNSLINIPEDPVKEGYSFVGWYKEIDLINRFNFTNDYMPANNLTLYAGWNKNSYTVTFNSLGGSSVEALTVNYNEAIIAPEEPTRTGYTFSGWYSDESLTNEYIFTSMPANNITLYAGWIINTYVVKFYNDDNTFLSEVVVNHGSNANFQIPTKESTVKYHYEFSGWSLSVNNVISDLTVYATYNEVLRSYTVIFYSKESSFVGDNPVLKTNLLPYGSLIDPPSEPIKESTAQYSYIFSGWDKDFSIVEGNLTIYPIFTETLREYTVIFYDDDYETILKEEKLFFGSSANPPANPIKESTPRYDYDFAGWDKDFSIIEGNLNVYATYNRTIRTYNVNFYNGLVLLETIVVEYGSQATTLIEPTKPSTEEFTYQFIGWDKELLFVVEDTDVFAVFAEKQRQYTVYFYDDDGGYYIDSVVVNYGEKAIFDTIPEKASTEKYDYEFIGWSEDLTKVTKNMQVHALYEATIRDYTVSFLVYDNILGDVVLKEETVSYGNSATPPIEPEKASTEKYDYMFDRWSLDYTFVDGNIRVYAVFTEVLREYKVSFYSENKLYKEVMTAYGNNVILPTNPIKEATVDKEFSFSGWYINEQLTIVFDPLTEINGNLNLYAKYEESLRNYTVKFYNDNSLFAVEVVPYSSLVNRPQNPTKASTTYYDYEFIGWFILDEEFSFEQEIKTNLEVHAAYVETLREYTVYFYDGQILLNEIKVAAGEDVIIDDPIKESTPQFHYEFMGWDKSFSNVVSNLTVYAIFEEILREYSVYFYNDLNEIIKIDKVFYGKKATAPEQPTKASTEKYDYEFIGWNIGFINVYNDLHVYPIYNETIKTFSVKFYNEDILLRTSIVEYGSSLIAPPNPTKESTEMYDYIFTGWSDEYDYIVANLEIYAVYEEVIKTFIVAFYNHDGLIKFSEVVVAYGMDATAPENIKREKTDQYEYIFTGWDKNFSNVKENLNVYATYERILRSFTVNFYSEEVLVDSVTVSYGYSASSEIIPTKEGKTEYNYIFTGWSLNLDYIISDLDVYAVFKEEIKTFNVIFYNDNSVLKRETVSYGSNATPPINPSKPKTEMHEYIFTGWNIDYTNVVNDLNVYALFNKTLRGYTVKFYNDDNSLLKEEVVLYGSSATPPEQPNKPKTSQYSYIFSSWNVDYSNIVSDLNVYAVYESKINSYEVVYYDDLNNVYQKEVLPYGTLITPPKGPIKESDKYNDYTFKDWTGYVSGMTVTENVSFMPTYEEKQILYNIVLFINHNEYRFELPYLSLFPELDGYIVDNNKYTYVATGAETSTGEALEAIPKYVENDLTLTIIYTPYIKVSYLTDYLNNTSFNSPRGYRLLVDAYSMLEEVLEAKEDLLVLFKEKESEYNEFVEKTFNDLIIVSEYENKIFNGYFEINLSLQLLSYAFYFNKRRWFYA